MSLKKKLSKIIRSVIISVVIVLAMFCPICVQELLPIKQGSFSVIEASQKKKKSSSNKGSSTKKSTSKKGNGLKKEPYVCKNYCGRKSAAKFSFHPYCSQKCKDAGKKKGGK